MTLPVFPSLLIRRDALIPRGAFAESQATFLHPDAGAVHELTDLLKAKQIGVVAHFYMDVELQGILTASDWPHIQISDSLAMADRAVKMAEAGMKHIVVLGVDFMSENVRAVLDSRGFEHIPVYRLAAADIGCSLAESAEARAYGAWLTKASETPRSLHVVYINTSLETKARAHHIVPTITCTSSNVVRTVMQAFEQVPDLTVWYGPDTYMGANLHDMFERRFTEVPLDRFHYFRQGTCIVHHMFGADVVQRVREHYSEALHTAHLEVPGEMFALAVEAEKQGRGVVGSTSNILGFINDQVDQRVASSGEAHLDVVLGTEAGMITSIVKSVQTRLREHARDDVEVEVVFPVSTEAVTAAPESELQLVPGVQGGEGCSTAGGCATCPFMKMNNVDSLFDVLERIGGDAELSAFYPRKYTDLIDGRTIADIGSEPILHMRDFQRTGRLPDALVAQILG